LNVATVAFTAPELHKTSDLSVVVPISKASSPCVDKMNCPHGATASLTSTFVSDTAERSS